MRTKEECSCEKLTFVCTKCKIQICNSCLLNHIESDHKVVKIGKFISLMTKAIEEIKIKLSSVEICFTLYVNIFT